MTGGEARAVDASGPGAGMLEVAASMLASALVGAPLFVAVVVRMVLFVADPGGALAHGHVLPIVFAFAATFAVALIAAVVVLRRLRAQAGRIALRVPFMILVVQIVIGVAVTTALVFTP
jgi:hypothetical protein